MGSPMNLIPEGSEVAAGLFNLLSVVMEVGAYHEAGHANVPFNELSDSLCTAYNKSHLPRGRMFPLITWRVNPVREWAVVQPMLASWCFIFGLHERDRHQYPVEVEDGEFYLSTRSIPVANIGLDAAELAHDIDGFMAEDI